MRTADNLLAIIMAGGSGTRFWPLSTDSRPKQFLKLFDDRSLLQKSFDRLSGLLPSQRTLVLTNQAFVEMVREQLPELPPENVIGEPMRRDTAAAICLGALLAHKRFGNPVIATLTADHLIEPVDLFQNTLVSAADAARKAGCLYTFGIRPNYPATGYGYLEMEKRLDASDQIEHYQLSSFREKPDLETARRYAESGKHYWNSGMFVWTAEAILGELEAHLPAHLESISTAVRLDGESGWMEALTKSFEPLEAISIDYGVMEKARDVRSVVAPFSWADVGGWMALKEFLPRDNSGNSYRGGLETLDSTGNLVYCEDPDELVVLVGVEGLVAVRAGNRTLIAREDRVEEIKSIVQSMQKRD